MRRSWTNTTTEECLYTNISCTVVLSSISINGISRILLFCHKKVTFGQISLLCSDKSKGFSTCEEFHHKAIIRSTWSSEPQFDPYIWLTKACPGMSRHRELQRSKVVIYHPTTLPFELLHSPSVTDGPSELSINCTVCQVSKKHIRVVSVVMYVA